MPTSWQIADTPYSVNFFLTVSGGYDIYIEIGCKIFSSHSCLKLETIAVHLKSSHTNPSPDLKSAVKEQGSVTLPDEKHISIFELHWKIDNCTEATDNNGHVTHEWNHHHEGFLNNMKYK